MNKRKLKELSAGDPYVAYERENSQLVKDLLSTGSSKLAKEIKKFNKFQSYHDELRELTNVSTHGVKQPLRFGTLIFDESFNGKTGAFFQKRNGKKIELLDLKKIDPTGSSFVHETFYVNPDESLVALQVQREDEEKTTLYVVNCLTGLTVDGPIEGLKDTPVYWRNNISYFYIRESLNEDSKNLSEKIFYRTIGTSIKKDVMIYGEGNANEIFLNMELCDDNSRLLITESYGAQDENSVIMAVFSDEKKKARKIINLWSRSKHTSLTPTFAIDGSIYALKKNEHSNGKIYEISVNNDKVDLNYVISAPENEIIIDFTVSNKFVYITTSVNTLSKLYRFKRDLTCKLEEIILPFSGVLTGLSHDDTKPGNVTFLLENSAKNVREFIYNERSNHIRSRYKDVTSKFESELMFKQIEIPVPGYGFITANLLFNKNVDGKPLPTMIYVYGGFSDILSPEYRVAPALWASKGGLWVDLHIRGGAEQGEKHHIEAMGVKKQNGVDDIFTGVEYLIKEGYADAKNIGIKGASNGGLMSFLAGSQRPDLFKVVISEASPLDLVRYPLGGMGMNWLEEYGDPTKPDELAKIYEISPYHNIKKIYYPKTLLATFGKDIRVPNWHGFKTVAKLADTALNPEDIYHFHGSNFGHNGGVDEEESHFEAIVFSFSAHYLGLER